MQWINLLQAKNYAELDAGLNRLQQDFEAGTVTEKDLSQSFNLFQEGKINSVETALRLDEWARTYPNSYAARLARGLYLANDGYMRRGADTANNVRGDQWHGMLKSFNESKDDLKQSLSLTQKPVLSYLSLMEIEMAGGNEDKKQVIEDYYQAAIKAHPLSFEARKTKLMTLRAEWGGRTLEPMERFLKENSHKQLPEAEQKELLAIRYGCEGHWYEGFQNSPQNALWCFDKAIATFPKGYFYMRRARTYALLNNLKRAKEDMVKAEQLGFKGDSELMHASVTYFILGEGLYFKWQYKEAIQYLERAIEVDSSLDEAKAFLALCIYARNPSSKRGKELIEQASRAGNGQAQRLKGLFSGNWYTWLEFHISLFLKSLTKPL